MQKLHILGADAQRPAIGQLDFQLLTESRDPGGTCFVKHQTVLRDHDFDLATLPVRGIPAAAPNPRGSWFDCAAVKGENIKLITRKSLKTPL